jgi:hypothetical protein
MVWLLAGARLLLPEPAGEAGAKSLANQEHGSGKAQLRSPLMIDSAQRLLLAEWKKQSQSR